MLELIKSAKVKDLKVKESYKANNNIIEANVNANKIMKVIYDFIQLNKDDPMFLFIEVPTNLKNEKIDKETTDSEVTISRNNLHNDVYYLDGLNEKELKEILEKYTDILVNDSLSSFGVGSNINHDEIGKYDYNYIKLFSYKKDINHYKEIFDKNNIKEDNNFICVFDTINKDNPGERNLYKKDNKDIYDVVKELEKQDMYFAERRED